MTRPLFSNGLFLRVCSMA